MIKTKKGNTKARGSNAELLADLAVIVNTLYTEMLLVDLPEDKAKEVVFDTVNTALMTDEERAIQMASDIVNALKKKLASEESEDEAE